MKGDIYHIVNRGVNKQKIFLSDKDYERFVTNLYVFNNKNGAIRVSKKDFLKDPTEQEKIVEILKWTLMSNHYHLLVEEVVDGGVVDFVKRIGNGYTKYFNIKNNRSGYLFQNAAKIILAKNETHFAYLPIYIDLNPIDLVQADWKENGIKDSQKVLEFISSYKWASVADYIGKGNYPSIINKEKFFEVFEYTGEQYKKELKEWINNKKEKDRKILKYVNVVG